MPVEYLPNDVLRYLLNSRYCEVDKMSNIAAELFGAARLDGTACRRCAPGFTKS